MFTIVSPNFAAVHGLISSDIYHFQCIIPKVICAGVGLDSGMYHAEGDTS